MNSQGSGSSKTWDMILDPTLQENSSGILEIQQQAREGEQADKQEAGHGEYPGLAPVINQEQPLPSDRAYLPPPRQTSLSCELCLESFPSKVSLLNHRNATHNNKVWKCRLCPEELGTYAAMINHERQEHSSNKCSGCGKSFWGAEDLEDHIAYEHLGGMKNWVCPLTRCSFAYRESIGEGCQGAGPCVHSKGGGLSKEERDELGDTTELNYQNAVLSQGKLCGVFSTTGVGIPYAEPNEPVLKTSKYSTIVLGNYCRLCHKFFCSSQDSRPHECPGKASIPSFAQNSSLSSVIVSGYSCVICEATYFSIEDAESHICVDQDAEINAVQEVRRNDSAIPGTGDIQETIQSANSGSGSSSEATQTAKSVISTSSQAGYLCQNCWLSYMSQHELDNHMCFYLGAVIYPAVTTAASGDQTTGAGASSFAQIGLYSHDSAIATANLGNQSLEAADRNSGESGLRCPNCYVEFASHLEAESHNCDRFEQEMNFEW